MLGWSKLAVLGISSWQDKKGASGVSEFVAVKTAKFRMLVCFRVKNVGLP